jgi:hypothetical protein
MTFSQEEYAKLTEAQRTALFNARKEARDQAPSRSVSTASTAPTPAPAPAPVSDAAPVPVPVPVQRTVQAIGRVPTAPAAAATDTGQDLRHVLSNAAATTRSANQAQQATSSDIFVHDGVVYQVGNHNIKYHVQNNTTSSSMGALVDGGANGGLSGSDVRVIETSYRKADVTGIGDQTLQGLPIALVAALIQTKSGYIIGIFTNMPTLARGRLSTLPIR